MSEEKEEPPLTLEQIDMLMQFPKMERDVYYAEGQPDENYDYPLSHDEVLTVPIDEDEVRAKLKLTRLAHSKGMYPVGEPFYTARFWCQRVSK